MALKKSEPYSSRWRSCDEWRGGMEANLYKDCVLVLLFIKYVSDKYARPPYAPITIPPGASFKEMAALKDKGDIGEQINKKIIAPLIKVNKLSGLQRRHQARPRQEQGPILRRRRGGAAASWGRVAPWRRRWKIFFQFSGGSWWTWRARRWMRCRATRGAVWSKISSGILTLSFTDALPGSGFSRV